MIDENTFTVTTGHQLNLFTGPLYTIYKILTTIKLAQQLAIVHPDKVCSGFLDGCRRPRF
ncbi:MAG: bacillithiol biosynthesis BshC [Bacteroidetes bacterium]|nr:bacillithiol biosynthesis BshC [Bacteroidota bacterium]